MHLLDYSYCAVLHFCGSVWCLVHTTAKSEG